MLSSCELQLGEHFITFVCIAFHSDSETEPKRKGYFVTLIESGVHLITVLT